MNRRYAEMNSRIWRQFRPSIEIRFAILRFRLLPQLIFWDALIDDIDSQFLCPLLVAVNREAFNRLPTDIPPDLNRIARLAELDNDTDAAIGRNQVPGGNCNLPVSRAH